MEKKIENSKPILNRARRQLLLGAGLTPVVMTLHAAKVMAQDVGAEGPSKPLAPYSAVIRGSTPFNSQTPSVESENNLYDKICKGDDTAVINYYGGYGSSGTVPKTLDSYLATMWSSKWTLPDSNKWTYQYEKTITDQIDTHITITLANNITELNSATTLTEAATSAYNAIKDTSITFSAVWAGTTFTIASGDTNGVKGYYNTVMTNLKQAADEKYNSLSSSGGDDDDT